MQKKKPSISKLLTGEHIKGLGAKKPVGKYEEGALFSQVDAQMKNLMPLKFQNGGTQDGEPDKTNQPVEVYEGSPEYNNFLNWQAQNNTYSVYNTANTEATNLYGQGKPLSPQQFKSVPGFSDFNLPIGATGAISYSLNGNKVKDFGLGENLFSTADGSRIYIPTYGDPGQDKYKVVESPEEQQRKAEQLRYAEENKNIQGWVRNTYYDPESGSNKTELVPLPNGQPIPTSGTFVPKESFEGGTTPQYPNGGLHIWPFRKRGENTTNNAPTSGMPTDIDAEDGIEGSVVPQHLIGKNYHIKPETVLNEQEVYYRTLGDVLKNTFKSNQPAKVTYAFEEGGEKEETVPQLLTGENITELESNNRVMPNAEVEDGEYIKFPDNTVQKATGEKHSNGGIDLHIPDGTKIISNKRTLTKKEAEALNKEYEIKVSEKHTYSDAIDKYVNKIGLKRLYDDQEQLFEQLEKVVKESDSEGSSRINKEYLSKKIHQIETQKEEKERLKLALFDKIFTMQEVTKRAEEKEDVDNFFEEGGISREAFKKVVNRYGLSEREGVDLYKGKIPERLTQKKYQEGGEKGDEPKTVEEAQQWYLEGKITRAEADYYETILDVPPVKFNTTTGEHEFSNSSVYAREKQSAGDAAFGKITKENLPMVLNNLYRNFPDIVAEEYGVKYNEDGTVSFDENINFAKASDAVKHFQERAQKRMTDTANLVISNPDAFQPEYVQSAKDYLANETFDESLARGIDSKQGQFTSGRYSLGIDVVTPQEQAELATKGIFTTKQLQDSVDSGDVVLSQPSLERLQTIRDLTPEGTDPDFALNALDTPSGYTPRPDVIQDNQVVTSPIVDDIVVPNKKYPRLFATPDQTPLPPAAMEAHLMGNIRLERIDPVRIGIESELQQASDAIKEGSQAMEGLPPNQRAAAIVGLQANVQKGINEAIHQANVINAQNQASAELFNIGQSGQEEQLRLNNLLSFEQRQLTAKAKTEEEVRNYYDQLNRINVNNFRNQQDLNLLQTLSPDYSLNTSGTGIEFTPEGTWKVQDNSKLQFKDGGKYKNLFY